MVKKGTVLFSPDKSDMLAVATKNHGNVSAIAQHYGVARDTVYQYFDREPEGKKIIDQVRKYNTNSDLDLAEYVIRYNMTNVKTNPGLAQRAAEKVIDRKGHHRDWGDQTSLVPKNDETLSKILEELKSNASES